MQTLPPSGERSNRAIHNSTRWKRGVHADGQNRNAMRIEVMRKRGGARTHEFPWRKWQVDTNQTSRTEYNSE